MLSNVNEIISETLRCLRMPAFFKHRLLGRCRYLVYNVGNGKEGAHYKKILKYLNAGEEAHLAFVGFDANMRGPVFAYKRSPRKETDDPTEDEGGDSDLLFFNMKGVVFKYEPLH